MTGSVFYKGKNVLVTGATGLIGTNLARELAQRGAHVRGTIHVKDPLIEDPNISYVKCDLTRQEDCLKVVENVDYAFFCAANTSGAHAIATNPLSHVTDNLIINARLLAASGDIDRCLFISSSTVYPSADYAVKEDEAFRDDPHPSYFGSAWMKRYSEKLIEFYCEKYDRKIAVVRPTNVYGPFDKFDFETSHVLPALVRRAVEKQNPLEVWGDGSAVRDFIYVSDLVEAMLQAMERCQQFDPVNIGSGNPVTIKDSLELILRIARHTSAEVIYDSSKPTTIPFRVLDLSKSREQLGFLPKVSLEEGLTKTIAWYLENV